MVCTAVERSSGTAARSSGRTARSLGPRTRPSRAESPSRAPASPSTLIGLMASGGGGCKGGGSEGGGSEEVLLPSCTVLAPPAETYCRRPCASRCQPVPSSLRAFSRATASWSRRARSSSHVGCAPSLGLARRMRAFSRATASAACMVRVRARARGKARVRVRVELGLGLGLGLPPRR